jgi:hydrogenase expression/formation protein HypC
MCLAVPGKVTEWLQRDAPFARARVEFGAIGREVSMQCVPEANVGDYVLVHAGLAISRIDPVEAERILNLLDALELREDRFGCASEAPMASGGSSGDLP